MALAIAAQSAANNPPSDPPRTPPPPTGPRTPPPPTGPKKADGKAGRRPLATTEELGAYLGIPVATLHQWRHKGVGPRASKVGRWLRYRWDDVEKWLDEQAKTPAD